jgi:hypothetical protein
MLFAVFLYIALICAGFAEFKARIPKMDTRKKHSRKSRRCSRIAERKKANLTLSPPGEP